MELNNKDLSAVYIIATILGLYFNFKNFYYESSVSLINVFFSFIYLIISITLLYLAVKNRNRLLKTSRLFWGLTSFCAILLLYVGFTKVDLGFLIPVVAIFVTPWYGLISLLSNTNMSIIFFAIFSLLMLFSSFLIPVIITKKNNNTKF